MHVLQRFLRGGGPIIKFLSLIFLRCAAKSNKFLLWGGGWWVQYLRSGPCLYKFSSLILPPLQIVLLNKIKDKNFVDLDLKIKDVSVACNFVPAANLN